MLKFGIRARLMLLLMAVTIVPMVGLNLYWTTNQRNKLEAASRLEQKAITQSSATSVNAFLSAKIRALIIHSQSSSVQQLNAPLAAQQLTSLFRQDKDILSVSLAGKDGKELVNINNRQQDLPLEDISQTDAFRVVNFLAGKEYVSPVTFDDEGDPQVTISAPLLVFTRPQDLGDISTAEPGVIRSQGDIKGALVTVVNLKDLWQTVLSETKSSTNRGYAYVVDDKGTVIAHPNAKMSSSQFNAAQVPIVSAMLADHTGKTTDSIEGTAEDNTPSLATYQKISAAPWAVVFSDPLSSIYADVDQVSRVGLALSLIVIVGAGIISLLLSRSFTAPILAIGKTAEQIGRGNLDATVPPMKRNDELSRLGTSINSMGASLKKVVRSIEGERNQLEIVLNSTAEGVLALNSNGQIVLANQAAGKLTARAPHDLVGKFITDVFAWTKAGRPFQVNYLALGTATYDDLEYQAPDDTNHFINLAVSHTAQSIEGVQAIVTIHDETKSRELDAMKLDFVSMAAHELRTPITGIRGYLELILYKFEHLLDDQVKVYVNHAHNSSIELIGLINNLLNISRIERGALVLTMEKIDWVRSIQRSLTNAQFSASEKGIDLKYEGPDRDCFIAADLVAIQEVINNLLSNAIKYTPENGRVTVRLKRDRDVYLTEVTDTGIGIPANAQEHLFTKFYRVHGGLASGSGGTGLGLFISRSIVERHGGKIWVTSRENHGSTFAFTIPIYNSSDVHGKQTEDNTTRRQRGWITKNINR